MIKDNEYLDKLFNSTSFKKEMEINIKQILIDRPVNCKFEFNANEKECYTDGRRIVIGKLDEIKDFDEVTTYALIKGLVGHEASHIKWSNFNELKLFNEKIKKLGYTSSLALSVANILEDGRIERLLCNYLKGYSKYIEYLNLIMIYNDGCIEDSELLANLINTILFLAKIGTYPNNFKEIFSDEEQYIIKNEIQPKVASAVSALSHKAVLDLTLEILDILLSKFKIDISKSNNNYLNKLLNDNSNPGYNTSEGLELKEEVSNTSQFRDNKSKSEVNAHCPNNNSFKMDLNTSNQDLKNSINNELDKKMENIKNKISEDYNNSKRNFNKEMSDDKNSKLNSDSEDYFDNIDLLNINNNYNRNYLKEPNFKYEEIDAPYMPYPSEFMSDIKILEKQFKQLLKNDDEFVKKQKRGRIDSSSLWKINTIYNNNVFIKKTIQNESDYGIYILIDLSGSMDGGDKYKQAITTALKIEGALANLSGVKVKTVGFDYTNRSRLRVFKNFNDKKTKTPNALYNSYIGSSNRDGFAIRVALEDLKRINCKNKLLVVISDGRPAWDGESIAEAMLDVKKAVHEGRKESMIMSVLINNGRIFDNIKESFHYMYEDKGTIMVDIDKEPEILLGSIVYYLKKLFKKR